MSFKTKTVLAPIAHMAAFAAIAEFVGPGLTTKVQLDRAIGAASTIPFMKLKPEYVTEVAMAGAKLIETMHNNKTHDPALVSQLIEHVVDAGNQLVANNHQKQNGTGDVAGVQQKPNVGQSAGSSAQ